MCLSRHLKILAFAAVAAAIVIQVPADARAQTIKEIEACLVKTGVLQPKAPSGKSSKGQIYIAETRTDGSTSLRRMMAHACFVTDLAFVEEMIDTAVTIKPQLMPTDIKVSSGKPTGSVPEPGLLGLDGAEDTLTELLVAEAYGWWLIGIQNGSPLPEPTPEELQAYVDAVLEPARKDPDGAMSLRIRLFERVKEVVLGREKPSAAEARFINALQNYIRDQYVRMAREAKKKYEEYQKKMDATSSGTHGMAILFFTGHEPFDALTEMKKALTLSTGSGALIAGIRQTKKLMAAARQKVFDDMAAKIAELKADDNIDDVVTEWKKGVVTESKNPEIARNQQITREFFQKRFGASKTEGAGRRLGSKGGSRGIRKSITSAIGKVGKLPAKVAGKIAGKVAQTAARLGAALGLKAINAVPFIGQIVDVIITSAEQISKLDKNARIEKELDTAEARFKATDWSLKKLLNTRSGTEMVEYFYAKATSSSSPESYVYEPPPCRACFFAKTNFQGDFFCTGGRVTDLRAFNDGEKDRKFNNLTRSVQLFGDNGKCKAPQVILNENARHSGDRLVLRVSAPDLSKIKRGNRGNWDKQVSSVEYMRQGAGPKCEVCLFKGAKYTSTKICTSQPIADLHGLGMGDRITSLKFNTGACPDAKLWAYRKKNFKRTHAGGGVKTYTQSTPNVGKEWNDRFSSVYFSPEGVSPKEELATDGCRVCLYEFSRYRGDYVCVNVGDKVVNLNKYQAGDETFKFANRASSAQFITKDCKPGEELAMALYSRASFKGAREILTKNSADLGKFDDKATSAMVAYRTKEQAENACHVCLYSQANFKGDRECYGKDAGNLSKITGKRHFNNKAQSIKFETEGCKDGAAVFYENVFKGDNFPAYKDIPDLKKIGRGKHGNWQKQISSLKFSKVGKAALEKAYAAMRKSVPWATK